MKPDHRLNTVGPWAAKKLDALSDYLNAYSIALSKQGFKRVYIDAFAGSCVSKLRDSGDNFSPIPLFDSEEDVFSQDQFIIGSPIRALSIVDGFHEHYFFDLDSARVDKLNRLRDQYDKNIIVKTGDSNEIIKSCYKNFSAKNVRGVAFLDPYGAHLEWETIKLLASTNNIEVIINFPVSMAINRLITRSGDIPDAWLAQLDKCFGSSEWIDLVYAKEKDLFGDIVVSKRYGVSDILLNYYMNNLRKIFPHVATPSLINNTKGAPLYYLIWAGPNSLGKKIANHILSQGEAVRSRKK